MYVQAGSLLILDGLSAEKSGGSEPNNKRRSEWNGTKPANFRCFRHQVLVKRA